MPAHTQLDSVRPFKVFVSSTFLDLEEHRARVINYLRQSGFDVAAMEDWSAAPEEPKVVSTDRIKGCDLFVLIVGRRRGFVPPGEQKSITQLEYEFALAAPGIDILVFIHSDDEPWLPRYDETAVDASLRDWRRELQERHTCGFFGLKPGSLNMAVGPSVTSWLSVRKQKVQESASSLLDEAFRVHLHFTASGLEDRRARYPRDLQRNVLDFYIDARGATAAPPRERRADAPEATRLRDLLQQSIQDRQPAIVLADFGMGKTWFLEHLKYDLAHRALERGDPVIPLWVNLRNADPDAVTFKQLRKQAWVAAFGERLAGIAESALVELFEEGRFVFLLDGLDEMRLRSRQHQDRVLESIGDLREHSRRSAVIVTCRRSFFVDAARERRLPDLGFNVFYLWPWSRSDILAYLTKAHAAGVVGVEPATLVEQIEQTYDLSELSSRAMLSAMLASQWQELVGGGPIDLPSLYERHVERAVLEWQSAKSQQLAAHEIQQIMEEVAYLMLQLDSLQVEPAELDRYFDQQSQRRGMPRFSTEFTESFVRDVRTNSLLLRDGNAYVFCHASIWEFMVARKLKRDLENGTAEAFNVAGRGPQFQSVIQQFLIPMLEKENKMALMGRLFGAPGMIPGPR